MIRRILALLAVLAAVPGCDDPFIDPFVNDGRYFTVWGWLDPESDRQEVRVIPVTRWSPEIRSETDPNATLDARVFFMDLNLETESEWAYRRARLDDGTLAHVYSGIVDVRPSGRYRLEVRRSDGRTAWAETSTPADYEIEGVQRGEPYLGADGHLRQDVTLRGVASPWDLTVTYLAEGGDKKRSVWIDYGRVGGRDANGDWTFTVDLTADQVAVRADVEEGIENGEVPGPDENGNGVPFGLTQMGLRMTVLNEAWDLPAGPIDDETFSRPDILTNVANGYGFWGAAIRHTEQWGVATELSLRLGWDF